MPGASFKNSSRQRRASPKRPRCALAAISIQWVGCRQIPVGVCPTSNATLGLYKSIDEHPIERLRRAGVLVSVNTDDPVLLEVDLPTEYERCAAAFNWDRQTCRSIAATSISASFASADVKTGLEAKLDLW
jgi:adenosine deaminase